MGGGDYKNYHNLSCINCVYKLFKKGNITKCDKYRIIIFTNGYHAGENTVLNGIPPGPEVIRV